MKRAHILLAIAAIVLGCVATLQAQTTRANFDKLKANLDKRIQQTQDAKKGQKPDTWLNLAEAYADIAQAYMYNGNASMNRDLFRLAAGNPDSTKEETFGENTFTVFCYPRTHFYFKADGTFSFFKIVNPIIDDLYQPAFKAINKAESLDPEGKQTKKITEALTTLRDLLYNTAINSYQAAEYQAAAKELDLYVEIGNHKSIAANDSTAIFYSGLAYLIMKDSTTALTRWDKALELGYASGGEAYCNYNTVAKQMGNIMKGRAILEKGLEKFPYQQCIMLSLVDSYIATDEDPASVLKYVDRALEAQPDFIPLLFIKGVVVDRLGRFDEAIALYDKVIALDPNYYDAYYNKAIMYYNLGVSQQKQALTLPMKPQNEAEIERLARESKENTRKAIPPLETIYQKNPEHQEAKTLLKQLYFRYRSEPDMMAKYKAMEGK